ncbi:MAG TPA: SigB/SigF/SigG family RNA polymerase sigma factor [Mycobacterium sp.]|nr:SigB/SigF/SigG family RNA polymerase sigma factor [Mycobacterium sp.]
MSAYSTDEDYAEIEQLLAALADIPSGTPRFERKRDEIIVRCLPLADHIAYRFVGRGEPSDDLIQVARLGLVKAVDRYDQAKGRFLAFAVPTIFGEVRRYFRDNAWGMRVPRKIKDTHLRVRTVIEPMSQRLGRAPTASELAVELGVGLDEIAQSLDAAYAFRPLSLDATVPGTDGESTTLSRQGADDPRYSFVEDCVALEDLLMHVTEQERQILRMRFCECMTQTQIAQRLGKSQVHVSRQLASTLERLRKRMAADAVPVPAGRVSV